MTPPSQPTIKDVRDAIVALLRAHAVHGDRGLTIDEVGAYLLSSRSAVQRALREQGTTFSYELHRIRVQAAVQLLIRHRRTARETARLIGVTPDYLRTLVLDAAGIAPGNIRRVLGRVDKARRWRRSTPPAFGSRWYHRRRREWIALERDVVELLGQVPPTSPLRNWADQQVVEARKPDFRRNPHRDRIRRDRDAARQIAIADLEALFDDVLERAHRGGKE